MTITFPVDIDVADDDSLAKIIKSSVRDPRNITEDERDIVDIIYMLVDQERWDNIIGIACANNDNIKKGGGENKRSAQNFRKKIGH